MEDFSSYDYVKKEIQGSTPSMLNETVRLLNKLLEQQLHLISFDSEFPPEEEFWISHTDS